MPRSSGQVVISIDWNPRSNKHLEISQVLQHQQIAATWIAGTPQIAIPQGITKSDEVAVVVPAREEEDLPQVLRQQINTIEGQHGRVATASLQGHLIPRGLLTDWESLSCGETKAPSRQPRDCFARPAVCTCRRTAGGDNVDWILRSIAPCER